MENKDYVSMYRGITIVFGVLFFIGGILLGQENILVMFGCWISGFVFLFLINLLKDILQELRNISYIMNEKEKNKKEIQDLNEIHSERENENELDELISKLEK